MPSSGASSTKSGRPVRSRASSLLRTRSPTSREGGGAGRGGGGATGELHRVDNVLVAGATAQIPAQCLADFRFSRVRVLVQERHEGHEDAGGAEPALQRVGLPERGLQRVKVLD